MFITTTENPYNNGWERHIITQAQALLCRVSLYIWYLQSQHMNRCYKLESTLPITTGFPIERCEKINGPRFDSQLRRFDIYFFLDSARDIITVMIYNRCYIFCRNNKYYPDFIINPIFNLYYCSPYHSRTNILQFIRTNNLQFTHYITLSHHCNIVSSSIVSEQTSYNLSEQTTYSLHIT